jgi:hypothetical protein
VANEELKANWRKFGKRQAFEPSNLDLLAARRMAERLSAVHGGAVAFSQSGDPSLGDWGDAEVIATYGAVPDDLSTLSS